MFVFLEGLNNQKTFNKNKFAEYAVLTWNDNKWVASHHQVEYDLKGLEQMFFESGLFQSSRAWILTSIDMPYCDIESLVNKFTNELIIQIKYINTYLGENVLKGMKSTTIRIVIIVLYIVFIFNLG